MKIPQVPDFKPVEEILDGKYEDWYKYLIKLSPRIGVIRCDCTTFIPRLEEAYRFVRKYKNLEKRHTISDWPKAEDVAFIVTVDMCKVGSHEFSIDNHTRIFCFNNLAFGLTYFEWSGDGEEDPNNNDYSLGNFFGDSLSWHYVTKLIRDYIFELQDSLPDLPKD